MTSRGDGTDAFWNPSWEVVEDLVAWAALESGEFRQRLQRAGMDGVRNFEEFSAIPVLRKKELSRLQREQGLEWLLTCPVGALSRVYLSPGPLYDPEGRDADYWGWTEAFRAAGFRAGDVVQNTFSYHLTPAGLMLEEPLRALGCAVIPAGPGNSAVQLQILRELPVTGFVGMTSFLKTLGEKALAQGIVPHRDLRLRVGFVAAERLPERLRREVEAMFGMTIRQGYGTADVGCIAYECEHADGMHLSARCYVEICDPDTGRPLPAGEVGEVVVTARSRAYPLIRLATGDLSRIRTDPCPCGRASWRLAGILGRVDDTVKVRGQFVYPSQVAQALAPFPQIRRHQVVVSHARGKEEIEVVLETSAEPDLAALALALQEAIKLRPTLRVLPRGETLPADAAPVVDLRTYD